MFAWEVITSNGRSVGRAIAPTPERAVEQIRKGYDQVNAYYDGLYTIDLVVGCNIVLKTHIFAFEARREHG